MVLSNWLPLCRAFEPNSSWGMSLNDLWLSMPFCHMFLMLRLSDYVEKIPRGLISPAFCHFKFNLCSLEGIDNDARYFWWEIDATRILMTEILVQKNVLQINCFFSFQASWPISSQWTRNQKKWSGGLESAQYSAALSGILVVQM